MNLNSKYLSISSIFIVAALVIYQIHAQNSYQDELAAAKHSQEDALKLSRDTIASLQATIGTLNKQLLAETSRANDQNANPGAVASNAATAVQASANAAPQNIQERIRGLIASPEVRQMASRMMSKQRVNAVYGDFIRGLHLSASEKESLSQIFAGAMEQKTDLQLKVAAGQMSQSDYNAAVKAIDGKLRESLSGYLYKEEMTAFDQYEATNETRTAAKALQARESDLERNAPGLTADSRKYVARILAGETAKLRANAAAATTPNLGANALIPPLDSAVQQMKSEGVLDASQMAAVEDYVAQQKDMYESFSQFAAPLQGR